MQIWLKQGGKRLRIPVLPSAYTVSSGQDNTTLTVCSLGEIAVMGKRKLRDISFSCFFPKDDDTYVDGEHKTPAYYVRQIEKMKRSGPVKLVITGVPVKFNCTIETFEWGEDDGTGDISYSLAFKEYIRPSIPVSVLLREDGTVADTAGAGGTQQSYGNAGAGTGTRLYPSTEAPVVYTARGSDTLSAIARAATGSTSWSALYEANSSVIGSNPNGLTDGMQLTISNAVRGT